MKAPAFPYSGLVLLAIVAAWLGPGIAAVITGSDRATFLTASVTSALLAAVFLLLCVPLAGHLERSQREHFGSLSKVLDFVARHFFVYVGWPQSKRGWIAANLFLSTAFFTVAVLAFFWARGDTQSASALSNWLEQTFLRLFGR
jgi:hypothetical protein